MVGWECPTNPREASGLDPEAVHKYYHMYSDDDTFREAVTDDQLGQRSEHNIVTTLTWLDRIDAPTKLRSRQAHLATFAQVQEG